MICILLGVGLLFGPPYIFQPVKTSAQMSVLLIAGGNLRGINYIHVDDFRTIVEYSNWVYGSSVPLRNLVRGLRIIRLYSIQETPENGEQTIGQAKKNLFPRVMRFLK